MKVHNIHERELAGDPWEIGRLIDSLATPEDRLWPRKLWPAMKFDRPLGKGAEGGHGPIRYFVEDYIPGKSIRFRFTGPRGFNGFHGYDVVIEGESRAILRNTLIMETGGWAAISWPLIFGPMHDALLEDSLALAQAQLGENPAVPSWSPWVKFLRWILSQGKARAQAAPVIDRQT